jgi:hypothetical protein
VSAVAEKTEPLGVLLGNPRPHMQVEHVVKNEDGEVVSRTRVAVPHPFLKQSITQVNMWNGVTDPERVKHTLSTDNDRVLTGLAAILGTELQDYAVAIREIEDLLHPHAGGAKPTWVDCNDEGLARAIEKVYGSHIGQPTNLLTNAGRDALHHQSYDTTAPPAQFNYIALTASVVAPAVGDTALTGEIATVGGGLIRAQATFAHTVGTNTSTLTKTFTANGTDALPVTVAQIGVFNAAGPPVAGTIVFHTALGSTITLNVSGDSITVTETVTEG